MNIQVIFFTVFAVVVGRMLYGLIKHHGFRGMLFGGDIRRTLGEVSLESRGLLNTTLKVHQFVDDDSAEERVGVEVVSWSFASYQVLPLRLTLQQAAEFAALLRQATERQ